MIITQGLGGEPYELITQGFTQSVPTEPEPIPEVETALVCPAKTFKCVEENECTKWKLYTPSKNVIIKDRLNKTTTGRKIGTQTRQGRHAYVAAITLCTLGKHKP